MMSGDTSYKGKEVIKTQPVMPKYDYVKPETLGLSEVATRRLMLACQNGDVGLFLEEMEKQPLTNLDGILDEGREMTPLMLACENSEGVEMVRMLVEDLGVNVNVRAVRLRRSRIMFKTPPNLIFS